MYMITALCARYWRPWNITKYASIPMLNKEGEYAGTITEGDLLWGIKRYTNLNCEGSGEYSLFQELPRERLITKLYPRIQTWKT